MATIDSISISQPASDPNVDEGQTFTFEISAVKATHGGADYDIHFEWDQGLGDSPANYVDIGSSGDLSTAGTNPVLSSSNLTNSITVDANTEGGYFIRGRTVDNNDGGAEDLTATQAVTVNAAAAGGGRLSLLGVGRGA